MQLSVFHNIFQDYLSIYKIKSNILSEQKKTFETVSHVIMKGKVKSWKSNKKIQICTQKGKKKKNLKMCDIKKIMTAHNPS